MNKRLRTIFFAICLIQLISPSQSRADACHEDSSFQIPIKIQSIYNRVRDRMIRRRPVTEFQGKIKYHCGEVRMDFIDHKGLAANSFSNGAIIFSPRQGKMWFLIHQTKTFLEMKIDQKSYENMPGMEGMEGMMGQAMTMGPQMWNFKELKKIGTDRVRGTSCVLYTLEKGDVCLQNGNPMRPLRITQIEKNRRMITYFGPYTHLSATKDLFMPPKGYRLVRGLDLSGNGQFDFSRSLERALETHPRDIKKPKPPTLQEGLEFLPKANRFLHGLKRRK